MTPKEIWATYLPSPENHPVVQYRGIPHECARVIPDGAVIPLERMNGLDWLALPMTDPNGELTGIAYINSEPRNRPVYLGGYAKGSYTPVAPPDKKTIIHVVADPSDAIALLRVGFVASACMTPDNWSDPDLPNPFKPNQKNYISKGGNLQYVVKDWLKCGYQVVVPVLKKFESDYKEMLTGLQAKLVVIDEPLCLYTPDELMDVAFSWSENTLAELPRSIDVFSPLIDTNDKGKPLSTSDNLAEVARRIGCIIRYNVISKKVELIMPDTSFSVDNHANACLSVLISWANRFKMPTGNTELFLTQIADQNPYNPVANWVTSRKWDGTSRIQAFYDTLTEVEPRCLPDGRRLRDVLIMRWMVSAIAAAFEPSGISSHGVLVLQGDQYLGKTKWMKDLAPKSLGVIKDGLTLNSSDKDSVLQCVSHWIIELGELDATFRKSDIASLKSFITSDRDILRRPYDRLPSEFARRTVFFASVNPRQFLHDSTGNRRFWVIECSNINHDHGLDMQQVWAEFYELYKSGEAWFLSPEEMAVLNGKNEEFMAATPALEMVDSAFDWGLPANNRNVLMTATQIAHAAGIERPTKADVNDIAQHVRQKYKVIQRGDPRTKVKKFVMPATLFTGGKI